ncbi:uncharacterized protein LOC144661295 [Oculina patagonica]
MSSIVTAVFKATIGLLVNKGRDKAAEKLKDGDVTDQKFRGLIVREIDDIKKKLDGLSRKDLGTSISFFKEGIVLLCEMFCEAGSRSEHGAIPSPAGCAEALVKGVGNLDLTDLDESATKKLSDAKKRFSDARWKATEAFNNEALETSDRILAMDYRVMATILESVDNPANALGLCKQCMEELHSLTAVQSSFDVQLKKGIQAVRGLFSKGERRKIISSVCRVNRVIYDVMQTLAVGKDVLLPICPTIDIGQEKVDLLRDERITKALRKQGMEHCCVTPWSFGQEGEEEHKLKEPRGIATNSSGQFIVGDYRDGNVKVFDSTGTFMSLFSLPKDDVHTKLYVLDVATDMNDRIYVLAILEKPGAERYEYVYEFNNTADLRHKFPVRDWGGLTVTDSGKVLVLSYVVDVHETDGQFVRSFGEVLKVAWDITAANDGRVMILDTSDSCVHIFSEHGDHLNKFKLQGSYWRPRIAFHRASEHVVLADKQRGKDLLLVEVYTKDGEFVRSTQIHNERIGDLRGITVTTEGRIAVACGEKKVVVI